MKHHHTMSDWSKAVYNEVFPIYKTGIRGLFSETLVILKKNLHKDRNIKNKFIFIRKA